jgi:hypothetical protein
MLTLEYPRYVLSLALMLGLSGCATPRYETVVHREAPVGASAQACIQTCERGLEACKQACAEKYQSCLKAVEPEAEAHYRQTLDRYAQALEDYRRELAFQDVQRWTRFHWGHGRGGSLWYDPFPYPYFAPPPVPRAPSREEDLNRLREARCGGDCGCQSPYDACFVGCGGRIVSEQRCVADCPPGGKASR